jgi:hypothetical protein
VPVLPRGLRSNKVCSAQQCGRVFDSSARFDDLVRVDERGRLTGGVTSNDQGIAEDDRVTSTFS